MDCNLQLCYLGGGREREGGKERERGGGVGREDKDKAM